MVQVKEEAAGVAAHCGADIKATALSGEGSVAAQRQALATAGQLVVTTPGRVAKVPYVFSFHHFLIICRVSLHTSGTHPRAGVQCTIFSYHQQELCCLSFPCLSSWRLCLPMADVENRGLKQWARRD